MPERRTASKPGRSSPSARRRRRGWRNLRQRGARAIPTKRQAQRFALVHGNEILESLDSSYPKQKRYVPRAILLTAVLSALEHFQVGLPSVPAALPNAVTDAFGMFSEHTVKGAVDAVPSSHMSDTAKAFACALLEQNAKLLGAR